MNSVTRSIYVLIIGLVIGLIIYALSSIGIGSFNFTTWDVSIRMLVSNLMVIGFGVAYIFVCT
jgi:uncharacterized protein YacL